MTTENKWGELMDEIRQLEYTQSEKAGVFERDRVENIRERYQKLILALDTGYAKKLTLKHIAGLGAEFAEAKAYPYLEGSPF